MQLKVISINVWLGGKLFPELVDFLMREQADVVLMQEVYNGPSDAQEDRLKTLVTLKKCLPEYQHAFGAAFMSERYSRIEMGNAVLSRLPILKSDRTFFDIPYGQSADTKYVAERVPRNVTHAVLDLGGNAVLHAFSVHGIWHERNGGDTPRRIAMGETLARVCGTVQPSILAGDFNTWSRTKTIGAIASVMRSVFGDTLDTTFNLNIKTDPGFAHAAVDHLFVSHDISVQSTLCPDVEVSDHRPLIVTLEVPT